MRIAIALAAAAAVILSAGAATAGTHSSLPGKIIYAAAVKGGTGIFSISPNGGIPKPMTVTRTANGNPTWSPNARFFAFESNRLGDYNIYTGRADGTHFRELTFSPAFDGDPAWGRSNKIAFESDRSGNTEIWVVNPDGSRLRQLTTDPSFNGDPAWSPDGTKIAFTSTRGNGEV